MALNFPNPALQTPLNEFSPDSTPAKSTNGVTYIWTNNEKWVASSVVFNDIYVNKTGDNMTGDLTLGTDKITLNATNGSINSATVYATGTVSAGNYNPAFDITSGIVSAVSSTSATVGIQQPAATTDSLSAINIYHGTKAVFNTTYDGTTKIGGTLPSAPNISLNADGTAEFAPPTAGYGSVRVTSAGVVAVGERDISKDSAGSSMHPNGGFYSQCLAATGDTVETIHLYRGTNRTFYVTAAGACRFAGDFACGSEGSPAVNKPGVFIQAATGSTFSYVTDSSRDLYSGYLGAVKTFNVASDGTVTAPNITFNLEADDDTKYTATTNEDGEQILVYNGAVLDVKGRLTKTDAALQSLKTAAAAASDFATLKSAIATALADI